MPGEKEIVNGALRRLGQKRITALTELDLYTDTFEIYRDALIRGHPWNFAMTRASLAADATGPEWGFDNAFTLPAQPYCLWVHRVNNPANYPWKVEGRKIVTDLSAPLEIIYLARITDTSEWDALFVECLIAKLAMEWAEPLVMNPELTKQVTDEFEKKIQNGFGVDGQEGTTDPVPEGSWVQAYDYGSDFCGEVEV
jgi:hypothetical protein